MSTDYKIKNKNKKLGGLIMIKMVKNFMNDEKGQGMTEYGLVLGVIGIGAIVALVALRDQIGTLLTKIKESIFSNTPAGNQ